VKVMAVVLLPLMVLACMALPACGDPAQAEAAIQEWNVRTVAAMEAEGIDPGAASDDDWKRVGAQVAAEMLAESGDAPLPEPEPEPAQDWVEFGLGALATFLSVKGSVFGAQAVTAILRGKQTRGTELLGVIANPETSWPDTAKAIAAALFDTRSPLDPRSSPTV
jgi:hypothetical protein